MGRIRLAVAVLILGLLFVLTQKKPNELPSPQAPPAKIVRAPTIKGNEFEIEVIRITNLQRTSRGLRPLEVVPALMRDAQSWSHNQANRGRMYHSRMGHGENVAYGQKTPQEVMQAWMTSPGHRRNILNPRYTQIGVGSVNNGRSIYWTQVFE